MLWRCIRESSLPRELTPILKNITKATGRILAFFYLTSRRVMISLETALDIDYKSDRAMIEIPDLILATSLIISIKLLWGLDAVPR